MSVIFRAMVGPSLYRIYRQGETTQVAHYEANIVEKYAGSVLGCMRAAFQVSIYASPFILAHLYRRDYFTQDGFAYLAKFILGLGAFYVICIHVRGLARAANPDYAQFIKVLAESSRNFGKVQKERLSMYDFDFSAWPVEFSLHNRNEAPISLLKDEAFVAHSIWSRLAEMPMRAASWLMVNTFGLKMVYPGSIGLLQASVAEALRDGRSQLVLKDGGQRFKLETVNGADVDAMFFDRRRTKSAGNNDGSMLVISCEGNAGFYEIGSAGTPVGAGYSVLGWNHPGFGGSTGSPDPQSEADAADAVMRFALDKLGFEPADILVHGWSIGGFTATLLAVNYPGIRGLLLDATFDDLLHLAVQQMPKSFEPLVKYTIRKRIDLNIGEYLRRYDGPVRIVRRTKDEIIATRPSEISSNRGNNLLVKVLRHRYPSVFDEARVQRLWQYLSLDTEAAKTLMRSTAKVVSDEELAATFRDDSAPSSGYPSELGKESSGDEKDQMALFLADKYMTDFEATHCTSLPAEKFMLPWAPAET